MAIYSAGYHAFGCDLRWTENTGWAEGDHEGGFFRADCRQWILNNRGFDVVICWDLLEHLPVSDLTWTLTKIREALKPGGRLIAHVPNAEGLFGARIFFSDCSHLWSFTPQCLDGLLREAGFAKWRYLEDAPIVHGPISLIRRMLWAIIASVGRLIIGVETGSTVAIMSQNLTLIAEI